MGGHSRMARSTKHFHYISLVLISQGTLWRRLFLQVPSMAKLQNCMRFSKVWRLRIQGLIPNIFGVSVWMMVLLRRLQFLNQLKKVYSRFIMGISLVHLQYTSLSRRRWRFPLTHSHRETILSPRHTSWKHTFFMVLGGTSSCGRLKIHCPGRMGSGSRYVWTSMAFIYLHVSSYCTPPGATPSVWSLTPCLGTPTALDTGNQNSGRHYLKYRMCWTVPSSSQISSSMRLHSTVHSGH